ncbi:EAL domain-containing response regulator [uncultured Oceanisphaera sp.]|uniref:EAL domain-containing response regulator n=1 Tax=uncultured Oceanisphaera sp. TaxID=353858 RepID=UPI00262BF731|nr:EAL domain-containing response regulator [uncultured Oceanisphaera sp.]
MNKNDDMKVLIVDDDLFSLKLLAHMVGQHGDYRVDICKSAIGVLEKIGSGVQCPDLIFMDLNMPEMDGLELIRRLAGCGYTGALVLVSGQSKRILKASEELSRSYGINVLGHLEKPVCSTQLSLMLGRLEICEQAPLKKEQQFSIEEILCAIENREFINYYQPKVSLSGAEVKGVEALVRWRHPEHGIIFPDQFIHLVEHHGYINELTRLVLANAIDDAQRWRTRGDTFPVAINISMLSLSSFDFMDSLCQLIDGKGMSSGDFLFEVTESRALDDRRQPLEIMTRLKLKGFELAIDDFGTAYSNLSKLSDYPFGELKIDRSFINGIANSSSKANFYHACLALAGEYGMTVVAEGVETHEDWAFLKSTGCDMAQGYFISRPMPADAMPVWLSGWKIEFLA